MPDPTARPVGLWDYLWGNPTRFAQQPHSRGMLLGARYHDAPESRRIEDIRQEGPDYTQLVRNAYGVDPNSAYSPSLGGESGQQPGIFGATELPSNILAAAEGNYEPSAGYQPSFNPNWRPRGPLPPVTAPPSMGPSLPGPPAYDPAWAPPGITPGMPGWRTPPSPSGPHPRSDGGAVQPPIYSNPWGQPIGLTLNSGSQ